MKATVLALGSLVLSMNSFAGQKLSYDEVKQACQNPARFHNQIQPANMEISCSDVQTVWVPVANGNYTLPRARKVTVSMTSDKYEIPAFAKEVAIEQQGGPCPAFKEQFERITTTRATTCEEILAFQGTEVQFCTGVLDALRGSNKDAINVTDSGRVVSICNPAMNNPTPAPHPAPAPKPVKPGYGK